MKRFRGKGEDGLETFRCQGGVVCQDLLLGPAGSEKAEEELNGEVRSTRVPVRTVLASLAEGATLEEILEDFPSLNEESVRAVIAFAAASAVEDLPLRAVPALR